MSESTGSSKQLTPLQRPAQIDSKLLGFLTKHEGIMVVEDSMYPFKNDRGEWVHGSMIDNTVYVSPTLLQLLSGSFTFESALIVAEELANEG